MSWIEKDNEVYYRIYKDSDNLMTVVCMQWFDEHDYLQSRFVKNSSGDKYKFDTEEEAVDKLHEWYEPSQIDPEYLKDNDLIRD